jgi:hypothetical protein
MIGRWVLPSMKPAESISWEDSVKPRFSVRANPLEPLSRRPEPPIPSSLGINKGGCPPTGTLRQLQPSAQQQSSTALRGSAEKSYEVLRATTLTSSSWTAVGSVITDGSGNGSFEDQDEGLTFRRTIGSMGSNRGTGHLFRMAGCCDGNKSTETHLLHEHGIKMVVPRGILFKTDSGAGARQEGVPG